MSISEKLRIHKEALETQKNKETLNLRMEAKMCFHCGSCAVASRRFHSFFLVFLNKTLVFFHYQKGLYDNGCCYRKLSLSPVDAAGKLVHPHGAGSVHATRPTPFHIIYHSGAVCKRRRFLKVGVCTAPMHPGIHGFIGQRVASQSKKNYICMFSSKFKLCKLML